MSSSGAPRLGMREKASSFLFQRPLAFAVIVPRASYLECGSFEFFFDFFQNPLQKNTRNMVLRCDGQQISRLLCRPKQNLKS